MNRSENGSSSDSGVNSPRNRDEEWIQAISHGDRTAFKEMFLTHFDGLSRFAWRYVRSQAIAEELVQEVFLWIWEKRAAWKVEGTLKTYLYRSVRNKAMDYWRHERTHERYMEEYMADYERRHSYIKPPEPPAENEFVRAAEDAIEELPDQGRMIYKLSRLEGLTYREIAEVLEISPKTVETHMGRSLDFLRDRLSHYLPFLSVFSFLRELIA